MAQVSYVSAGTTSILATTGNLTGNLPAAPTTGNMLVAFVTLAGAGRTIATSTSGWSKVTTTGAPSGGSDGLFIAAVGAAAPVFTFTTDVGVGKICRIIEVKNSQKSDTSFVDATGGSTGAVSATLSHTALTAVGSQRLAVAFIFINSANAIPPLTGMTGGTWAESAADSTSGSVTTSVDTANLTSGTALTGGTGTITSASWIIRSIAIIPASRGSLGLLGVG